MSAPGCVALGHGAIVLLALLGCAPVWGPPTVDTTNDGAWCAPTEVGCTDVYQARLRACESIADEAGLIVDEVVDEKTHVDCVVHGFEHVEECSDINGTILGDTIVGPDDYAGFCVVEVS